MNRIVTTSVTKFVALAILLTGLLATSAHAQSFGAKPGAWETTVTVSGLSIPPEVLAKMPPDRRAMVEQKLAENGGGTPTVRKTCVTKENMEKGFLSRNQDPNCKVTVVSQTATKIVMTNVCTGEAASTGTMSFEAKTPESVVGNVDQDRQGRKVHVTILGKWLGASCDGIAPMPTKGG
jgi:hypothetical protein